MFNRRNIIGGAAALPVIAAASCSVTPAAALLPTADRHGAWLAERNRMNAQAEAMCDANENACETPEYDRLCNGMQRLENRMLATPAANATEARSKLRLAGIIYAEGVMLEADDAGKLLAEIAPLLAAER